jgi:hypothetical protein
MTSARSPSRGERVSSFTTWAMPNMAFNGVRISWLSTDRKADFAARAAFASAIEASNSSRNSRCSLTSWVAPRSATHLPRRMNSAERFKRPRAVV